MEYMRGLLRDNDLFRAYVTVRTEGRRTVWVGASPGGTEQAGRGYRRSLTVRLPCCSGPRSTSNARG